MVALGAIGAASGAQANPWDIYSVGSRAGGMGGAVAAISRDGFATFYNPAALTLNPAATLSVTFSGSVADLSARSTGPAGSASGLAAAESVPDYAGLGFAATLPFHRVFPALRREVTLGVALGLPQGGTLASRSSAPGPEEPFFPVMEGYNDRLTLTGGIAAEIFPARLSAGLAMIGLANLNSTITIQTPEAPMASVSAEQKSNVSVSAGLLWTPASYIAIALTFRDEHILTSRFDVDVTQSNDGGQVTVPYRIETTTSFMPRRFGLGLAGHPTPQMTIALDTSFLQTSRLSDAHPIARLSIRPGGPELAVAPTPRVAARDVITVRVGFEYRDLWDILSLRAGYAYLPRLLDGDQPNHLLDADRHLVSAGFTVSVGPRDSKRAFHIGGHFHALILDGAEHGTPSGPVVVSGTSIGGGLTATFEL